MEKSEKIITGIKSYFKQNNYKKAVIGLSGGIDSALAALLVSKAVGSKNLFALLMPEIGISPKKDLKDAEKFAKTLGVKYYIEPINKFLKPFKTLDWEQSKTAIMNTKARIRANTLYNFANSNNALVIGTGNKSELMLGYFTKYGDSAADLLVLGNLWKTEVIAIARKLKIPEHIIKKPPSAGLWKKQTDEKELGANYKILDKILKAYVDEGASKEKIVKAGVNAELVNKVIERMKNTEHKRKPTHVIKC